jgi:hypothetical protein
MRLSHRVSVAIPIFRMSEGRYTTQFQAGLGMIDENMRFLELWEEGDSAGSLHQKALDSGNFPDVTARRLRNLAAEMFAPRFLTNGAAAAHHGKALLENASHETITQFIYLVTSRAQLILHDFVRLVYWPAYEGGRPTLHRDEVVNFIENALDSGKMEKRWSDSTIKRVSGYLGGCCVDFNLAHRIPPSTYELTPISMDTKVFLYLAHDMRFAGCSEQSLLEHRDWSLWGMGKSDVLAMLRKLGQEGHFIVQGGADLIRITWRYENMEEVLDAVA